jgi:hypothetical protein
MQQPPLLPDQVLVRVHGLARRNGWSIVLVSGLAALMSAAGRDPLNAFLGLLAAGCGAMEVHGAGLLRYGDERGTKWLIRAELFLLLVILAYCAIRLVHPNLAEMRAAFHASLELPGMREKWQEIERLGMTEDLYVNLMNRLVAVVFAFVSIIYQGGMALYYARRRNAVTLALTGE